MRFRLLPAAAAAAALGACSTFPGPPGAGTIQILAINDFHGNLEPGQPTTYHVGGQPVTEVLGGAARLGATLAERRQGQEHTITVAAGDLIGASPLISAYYLDEPAILALNAMGLSLAAVGNHEFDRGTDELRRMQAGGCEKHTPRAPCQIDRPFEGARFQFLAANVIGEDGQTLFPGTALRKFGDVTLGFIGMTLKETGTLSSPDGTRGYRFADEAETANRLAAELRAEGADALVLLLHQGGTVDPFFNQDACPGLGGDIVPILKRLTPEIRLVVSGHTHRAYLCEVPDGEGKPRLLTSAGRYGQFVTDISMTVDPATDRIVSLSAVNRPVSAGSGEQSDIAGLVARYAAASTEVVARPVGRVTGPLGAEQGAADTPLARLVADAQLAATADPAKGGAQIAFINSGGVRAGFARGDDGTVTFGQIFALQPFGNTLEVVELTGAQLAQALESQIGESGLKPSILIPSRGFSFTVDLAAPAGRRITAMSLDGEPIDPSARYRVAVNNFLANGGDGFVAFSRAPSVGSGGIDLDALEAYMANGVAAPQDRRINVLGSAPD